MALIQWRMSAVGPHICGHGFRCAFLTSKESLPELSCFPYLLGLHLFSNYWVLYKFLRLVWQARGQQKSKGLLVRAMTVNWLVGGSDGSGMGLL